MKMAFGHGAAQFLERLTRNLPWDFLGMKSAPMLGLRGCSRPVRGRVYAWWSLETDVSLKPPCSVMSPVKGLLAARELHKMLIWCLPGMIHTSLGFHTGKLFLSSISSA